jgi:hypothetical protein
MSYDQPKRKPFDIDGWIEGNTFTRFPKWEQVEHIKYMAYEEVVGHLCGNNENLQHMAILKLADNSMRRQKDLLLLRQGNERFHFKSEAEIEQSERLFKLAHQLAERALAAS